MKKINIFSLVSGAAVENLAGTLKGKVRLPVGVNSAVQKRTEIKFVFKKTIKQQKMHNSKLIVSGNLATGNCKETTVF